MFELMRRLKVKVKRITNTDLGNDGPAGCRLILERVFKEFSRIAKNEADIERIAMEGPRNNYLFDGQDQPEEDLDDIDFEDCEMQSDKKVAKPKPRRAKLDENGEVRKKRKYVRRNLGVKKEPEPASMAGQVESAPVGGPEAKVPAKKRRGRPPKKSDSEPGAGLERAKEMPAEAAVVS